MKLSDYLILAALLCGVVAAFSALKKQKKKGGCSGCAGCPMAGDCNREEKKHE